MQLFLQQFLVDQKKNLFLISNYLANKDIKVTVISADKNKRNRFNKNVKFDYPKHINFENSGRYKKYFHSLILLVKKIFLTKKILTKKLKLGQLNQCQSQKGTQLILNR